MKRFLESILLFLYRFLIDPCWGCVHEEDCYFHLKYHGGFCGDHGPNFYERKEKETEE